MTDNKDKINDTVKESYPIEMDKKDVDIMEKPKKKFNGAVETQNYDELPEFDSHEELADELKDKESVDIQYTFTSDDVIEGLSIYQASTLLKKNLIYSAILLAVFFVYMVNIIKNPNEVFSIVMAGLCVFVLAFVWILPKTHIKKTAKAVDLQEMNFSMNVYDDCIKVGEDGGSVVVFYNKDINSIFETPNLFIICAGKERIFILPKRCLDNDKQEKIKSFFKAAMNENYITK